MNLKKYSIFAVVILAMALAFAGCAKPPEEEKAAAKTALDAAMAAGADKYAAADFEAAKALWDGAESNMNGKKYKEAKQGYVDAKAALEKAGAAAEAGKKAATEEANAAVQELEEAWKKLGDEAVKLEKKMKEKKELWEADAKAFTDGLTAAKDMVAADPAGTKAKTGELRPFIDKWDALLKEVAATPDKPAAAKKAVKKKRK